MSTPLCLSNQSERYLGDEFHDLDIYLSFSLSLSFSLASSILLVHGQIAATASGEFDDTVIDGHPIAELRPPTVENGSTGTERDRNEPFVPLRALVLTKARWSCSYSVRYIECYVNRRNIWKVIQHQNARSWINSIPLVFHTHTHIAHIVHKRN